jgi:hypothetical protein
VVNIARRRAVLRPTVKAPNDALGFEGFKTRQFADRVFFCALGRGA